MSESRKDKIVEFDKYCKTCVHSDIIAGTDGVMPEPCNECLGEPVNENSKCPIKYLEDEEKIKKELNKQQLK